MRELAGQLLPRQAVALQEREAESVGVWESTENVGHDSAPDSCRQCRANVFSYTMRHASCADVIIYSNS